MTYATNLEVEGIESQYLAVIKPRRLAASASWSLVSGNIYKQSFDWGQVVKVKSNDTELTEDTTTAPTSNKWYWDSLTNYLYINIGADPSTYDITCTYEIYVGTYDAHWYKIPTDDTSRTVYYEPLITRSPDVKLTSSDALFGFMPTQSSTINLSNASHLFEYHTYDSSFNMADIDIYHWLGDLLVANLKLIFKGICKDVKYSDKDVTVSIYDRNDVFNKNYRNPSGGLVYTLTAFPQLDPTFENRTIRRVFGMVEGFIPVNIDYVKDNPPTTVNRSWLVCNRPINLSDISNITQTVPSSPSSSATRTYIPDASGFNIGDTVWLDKASDNFVTVTDVNRTGDNYIEHELIIAHCVAGDLVKRLFVGNVVIYKDNLEYRPLYGRDYSFYDDDTNYVIGIHFDSTMESNLGMTSHLQPSDQIFCRVYGEKNHVTLGGSPLGSDSSIAGNLTSAVAILFQLAKECGLEESEIDLTAFTSLISSVTDEISFAIPKNINNEFPTYKEIMIEILSTLLLKIFINNDNKWSFYQTALLGSVYKTIEDNEIIADSFGYDFGYGDLITDVFVEYAYREVSEKLQYGGSVLTVSASNARSKRLHSLEKQKTFKSLHFIQSEAQKLCDRLLYVLSERSGILKLSTKNRFFDTLLGDVIKVKRARLPGFIYDKDTDREKTFNVVSSSKSIKEINLELDDQKGIEDNAGSW